MTPSNLKNLLKRGNALEAQYDELKEAASPKPQVQESCVAEACQWLQECVAFGRFLPEGSPERRALQGRVDYWTSLLSHDGWQTEKIDRIEPFDPAAGSPLPDDAFPYPGLKAFTDAALFVGRDDVARAYAEQLEAHGALLIIGPSGSGKSSVAMAGVIPRLDPSWRRTPPITPGVHPLGALCELLAGLVASETTAQQLQAQLQAAAALAETALAAVAEPLADRPTLIFVDQLEELLTLCNDPVEQERFSNALSILLDGGRWRLLATMRSDHYDRLERSQPCRALFARLAVRQADAPGVQVLPPLGYEQIRQAILKPAEARGLRFVPPSIVDELAKQTANLDGGLPLLQFALHRLWQTRPARDGQKLDMITQAQLDALPDVSRALGNVAQAVYEGLPESLRPACRRLMLELTALDEKLEVPLRRRRPEAEVRDILVRYEKLTPRQAVRLVRRFLQARLLVRTGRRASRQIEVAHEAMFRHWATFQDWVSGVEARMRLQQVRQIGREAAQWKESGQDDDYLKLKGEPLSKALEYEGAGWLDESSKAYVRRCSDLMELRKAQQAEEARRRRAQEIEKDELRKAQQVEKEKRQQAARAWALGVALFVAVAGLGSVGYYQRSQNEYQKQLQTLDQKEKEIEQNKKVQQAHGSALLALISQTSPLNAWDALDLVNALRRQAGAAEPSIDVHTPVLAHAVEHLQDMRVLGGRRRTGADFTGSGQALIQLVGDEGAGSTTARQLHVFPVGSEGQEPAEQPFKITLDPRRTHRLVQVEVAPVDAVRDARLALLAYAVEGSRAFELAAYRLPSGAGGQDRKDPVGAPELFRLDNADRLSEITFDPAGQQALLVTQCLGADGRPSSSLVRRLRAAPKDSAAGFLLEPLIPSTAEFHQPGRCEKRSRDRDEDIVTAAAFLQAAGAAAGPAGADAPALVTGRLNGAVHCGTRPARKNGGDSLKDDSFVDSVRASAESQHFVAVQSNTLWMGNCQSGEAARVNANLSEPPKSLSLDAVAEEAGASVRLSYVAERRVRCVRWRGNVPGGAAQLEPDGCGLPDMAVDQAFPMGKDKLSFLAIENRSIAATTVLPQLPLPEQASGMQVSASGNGAVYWRQDASGQADQGAPRGQGGTARRLDGGAWEILGRNVRRAAVSPSGDHVAWIEYSSAEQSSSTMLHQATARPGQTPAARDPLGILRGEENYLDVAVGDQGRVVALVTRPASQDGARRIDYLLRVHEAGHAPSDIGLPQFEAGRCIAMSPDASKVVFADSYANAYVVDLDRKGDPQPNGADAPGERPRNAGGTSACAVANDGTAAVGRQDGHVLVWPADKGKAKDLTKRVAFVLSKGVSSLAVDPSGRFVAGLAQHQAANCLREQGNGHALRIWDLKGPLPDVPVSSTCIPHRRVAALGALSQQPGRGWVLSMHTIGSRPSRQEHGCLACAREGEQDGDVRGRLDKAVQQYDPNALDSQAVCDLYGIQLGTNGSACAARQ